LGNRASARLARGGGGVCLVTMVAGIIPNMGIIPRVLMKFGL